MIRNACRCCKQIQKGNIRGQTAFEVPCHAELDEVHSEVHADKPGVSNAFADCAS